MNIAQIDGPIAQRLGWTLIHFLWEGTLVALLLGLTLWGMRRCSARARYLAACAGMALLLVAPGATFGFLAGRGWNSMPRWPEPPVAQTGAAPDIAPSGRAEMYRLYVGERTVAARLSETVEAWMPALLLGWACGVALLSLRLGLGWWHMRRLVGKGMPLSSDWGERLSRLAGQLGVKTTVRLLRTVAGDTPVTLGWLRPIILMPASCLMGLPAGQLEALLAHELAHIRRHDYLINLLQCAAETLLFYHPAVWWVSAQIRREREHACDDVAVAACGDPVSYVKALASLETLRSVSGQLTLAANDGPLLARIRRLLGRTPQPSPEGGWLVVLVITLTLVLALSRATGQSTAESAVVAPVTPLTAPASERNPSEPSIPQVLLEVKFIELAPADVKAVGLASVLQSLRESSPLFVTNRSGILQGVAPFTNGMSLFEQPWMRGVESVVRGTLGVMTDPQMKVLLRAFEQRPGVNLLAAPRVTTLSGRQARVEIMDVRNTVAGLTAGETNIFSTTAIPVGPSVDLVPSIADDGNHVQITVLPGLTAFLGYEDPGPFQIPVDVDDGKPPRAQLPLPRFYASQTLASVAVPDGQTAVISGFRNLGPPSKTERKPADKQVVIFVTPTLIDATGRRIHEK